MNSLRQFHWSLISGMVVLIVPTMGMAACNAGPSSAAADPAGAQTAFDTLPPGDAVRGEQISAAQHCAACHVDHPVGPGFPGEPPLAEVAAARRAGYSAEAYLYESIVKPGAYVVPGFADDAMPQDIASTLTPQDMADLLAYLMTMH